jgi:hypothetical protein
VALEKSSGTPPDPSFFGLPTAFPVPPRRIMVRSEDIPIFEERQINGKFFSPMRLGTFVPGGHRASGF